MTLSPSTAQTAPAAKKYTTPEEQLERLVGEEWQSIATKIEGVSPLCHNTAMIIARYALEPRLTSWYTALQEIGQLPRKIPELSEEDIAFLNSPCPTRICKENRKPNAWTTPEKQLERQVGKEWRRISKEILDVSPLCHDIAMIIAGYAFESRLTSWYTDLQERGPLPGEIPVLYSIIEKCALLLIPEELVNLKELQRVVTSYGEKHYPEDKNPLKIVCYDYDDSQGSWKTPFLQKAWSTRFGPTHWELHSDLLEGSRGIDYACQTRLMESLAEETSKDWEVPELRGRIAAIFFLQIGSGETLQDLVPISYDFDPNIITDSNKHFLGCTGAWVKDTYYTTNYLCHLCVMNTSKGVFVDGRENPADFLGMGACLKL